jgi:hypothetical protein
VTTTTFHFSPRRLSGGIKRTLLQQRQSRLPRACRSDDDKYVPLFGEKARAKHAASLHATGMSDDDDDIPLFDEKAHAKHAASLHATGMSVDENDAPLMKMLK